MSRERSTTYEAFPAQYRMPAFPNFVIRSEIATFLWDITDCSKGHGGSSNACVRALKRLDR